MTIFDDLFGASSKRRDLQQAETEASELRQAGLNRFAGTTREGIAEATAPLRLGAETGGSALARLAAGSGAVGPEAQAAFNESFVESPGFQAELEAGRRNLERSGSTSGNIGTMIEAIARQGLLAQRGGVNEQLARLMELAKFGQSDATNIANITQTGFRDIGNAQFGTSQQDAAGRLGLGQAFADTRGSGLASTVEALKAAAQIASAFQGAPAGTPAVVPTATGQPGVGVGAMGRASLNRIPV